MKKTNFKIIVCFLGIIFSFATIGLISGYLYSMHELKSIALSIQTTNPNDPLDGLPIIGMFIAAEGLFCGTFIGFIFALIYAIKENHYLKSSRKYN
jgi:hypothetical protein